MNRRLLAPVWSTLTEPRQSPPNDLACQCWPLWSPISSAFPSLASNLIDANRHRCRWRAAVGGIIQNEEYIFKTIRDFQNSIRISCWIDYNSHRKSRHLRCGGLLGSPSAWAGLFGILIYEKPSRAGPVGSAWPVMSSKHLFFIADKKARVVCHGAHWISTSICGQGLAFLENENFSRIRSICGNHITESSL